MNKYNF